MTKLTRNGVLMGLLLLMTDAGSAQTTDLKSLLPSLKQGGYVIVLRHGATDASQQDVYPLNYTDMTKQRQLNDAGRDTARQIGQAFNTLAIPIGEVLTSRLNRAIETGRLISSKDVTQQAALNDSSAGAAGAMAGAAGGGSAAFGAALRKIAGTVPAAGTNTIVVTHKTNIIDAFGDAWAGVKEGEATIFKPKESGELASIGRVQAEEWTQAAGP